MGNTIIENNLRMYKESLEDVEKEINETRIKIQENVEHDFGFDQPGISTVHGALELIGLVEQKRMLLRFIRTLERIAEADMTY